VARANWGIGGKELLTMYKSIFVPTITYASGAWGKYIMKTWQTKLDSAQRAALLTVTKAYRTVSGPALLIMAGVDTVEHEIQKAQLIQAYRRRRSICLGGHSYDPSQATKKEAAALLQERQLTAHQQAWDTESRGRATFEHLPSVAERRQAGWIEPGYYLSQFLSGHGNFKAKLRKFSLVRSAQCRCGEVDTAEHTFQACPLLDNIRTRYKEALAEKGITWPTSGAEALTEIAYEATATFAREVLREKEKWDNPQQ
jgi:hypothetical protein